MRSSRKEGGTVRGRKKKLSLKVKVDREDSFLGFKRDVWLEASRFDYTNRLLKELLEQEFLSLISKF